MAGREELPFGFALFAVRNGMSGRAGLAAYREGGGRIGDARWYRMVGEARALVARIGDELAAPLRARPVGQEITPIRGARRSGYLQRVLVVMRDRDTGEIFSKPYTVSGRNILQRQTVIERALNTYTPDSGSDEGDVIGAIYIGTMEMIPE